MNDTVAAVLISALTLPQNVRDALDVVRLVLMILILLISVLLVVLVLIQPSAEQGGGMNAVTGSQGGDTYYSKNKSETRETLYKRLTIVLAGLLFLLVVGFFVTLIITGIN